MDPRQISTIKKKGSRRGKGEYIGVRFKAGKWISEIRRPLTKKRIWLGSHHTAERAARAHDAATYCLKGEKGNFNFPNDKRLNLTNKPIGSLLDSEIQFIAHKFAYSEDSDEAQVLSPIKEDSPLDDSVATPISERINLSTFEESTEIQELSSTKEDHMLVNSDIISISNISNRCCEINMNSLKEAYIPEFIEEEPLNPDFVTDGEFLAEQFLELDQWFELDKGWIMNSTRAPIYK